MPRGDRSGPNGMGPMTGRAAGFCSGYDRPGYMNPAGGRGYYGRGYGRGFGIGFAPTYPITPAPYPTSANAENESDYLENELNMLKEDMKHIEARLKEIKTAEK